MILRVLIAGESEKPKCLPCTPHGTYVKRQIAFAKNVMYIMHVSGRM